MTGGHVLLSIRAISSVRHCSLSQVSHVLKAHRATRHTTIVSFESTAMIRTSKAYDFHWETLKGPMQPNMAPEQSQNTLLKPKENEKVFNLKLSFVTHSMGRFKP